ncbi:MAG: discoidin domain-containing protein, partial [Candidatus Helarchaeota archaeon]
MSKILYCDQFEYSSDALAQAAYITDAAATELDYMEYSSDANAQAAYVSSDGYSSDLIPDMTSDTEPSGIASASTVYLTKAAWQSMDDDTGTWWESSAGVPQWVKYDFGNGNEKTITRYSLTGRDVSTNQPTAWTLHGSNNDSDWDLLDTQSGQNIRTTPKVSDFSNTTAYRYYRITITAINGGTQVQLVEWQLIEAHLQC